MEFNALYLSQYVDPFYINVEIVTTVSRELEANPTTLVKAPNLPSSIYNSYDRIEEPPFPGGGFAKLTLISVDEVTVGSLIGISVGVFGMLAKIKEATLEGALRPAIFSA
jgi:hypothetical protein